MSLTKINQFPINYAYNPETNPSNWIDSDDDAHGLGPLKAGWIDGGKRVTINELIRENVVPDAAKFWLNQAGWDGKQLSEDDIHQLHRRGLGLLVEAGLGLPTPAPMPTPIIPLTRDQVEAIMYEHGHIDAPLPGAVWDRYMRLTHLDAKAGEVKLRNDLISEGFDRLPLAVNPPPELAEGFNALEEVFRPLMKQHVEELRPSMEKIENYLIKLHDMIENSPAAGDPIDPRCLSQIRAALRIVQADLDLDRGANNDEMRRHLNVIAWAVPQIGRAIKDRVPVVPFSMGSQPVVL